MKLHMQILIALGLGIKRNWHIFFGIIVGILVGIVLHNHPNAFVDNAKVMAKGQITIPKDVRKVLGVTSGDRISFIVEGNTVRIVNSAVYAMQMLQNEMIGEAERAGLTSDEDIMALVKELRNEDENV